MMGRPMQRTLVIGDVHGCVDELRLLLRRCGYAKGDRVVLAGDLVAKGPDSQGVVELARENGFGAVLGNHDASALAHRREAHKHSGQGRKEQNRIKKSDNNPYRHNISEITKRRSIG